MSEKAFTHLFFFIPVIISYIHILFFPGHLRPSRELLEYYRKKIAEYDEEHDHMVSKLEEYKITYEEQVGIVLSLCKSLKRCYHQPNRQGFGTGMIIINF